MFNRRGKIGYALGLNNEADFSLLSLSFPDYFADFLVIIFWWGVEGEMASDKRALINPTNGNEIGELRWWSSERIDQTIRLAHSAHGDWCSESFENRSEQMNLAADLLAERCRELAVMMAEEMGKPVTQGRAEVSKCVSVCRYYAGNAEAQLADELLVDGKARSWICYRPLGVVLAVMPWNFPLWQVFRFAAPTLMAGNVALLKHASNVPRCAQAIDDIFCDARFPRGVFQSMFISSAQVADVIADERVKAVTLTGSTPAGRSVAALAGEHLKKTVLELGGSDPVVVLGDADVELAAQTAVKSRLINSGQSCIAAKRFIVVESVVAEFTALVVGLMTRQQMGDPLDDATDVGPMARFDLRDELHDQVKRSVEAGAELLIGGEIPDGPGAFYPPTVLTNVRPSMPAYDEELFGPVASIITVTDEKHAIHVANDTPFGLGAAVFTRNEKRGRRIARDQLNAGTCVVNTLVASDPKLPFGGIKQSGYGRELGPLGIKEFVNAKTVTVAEK